MPNHKGNKYTSVVNHKGPLAPVHYKFQEHQDVSGLLSVCTFTNNRVFV